MKEKVFLSKKAIFLLLFFVFFAPLFAFAQSPGTITNFNIDSQYDSLKRDKLSATLIYSSSKAYFYVENDYLGEQSESERKIISENIKELAEAFDNNIYPKLNKFYGSEWNPGIDKDSKITILFHLMGKDYAGYFKEKDEYYKQQFSESNEREMVYLNIYYLGKEIQESYLAHEFTHLITFNNKNRVLNSAEDVWITEMRSEYAPTICGYNDNYQGSVLSIRAKRFLNNPSNSLTKWENDLDDYATINIFAHYFADHYGYGFLKDSLFSKTGDYEIFQEYLNKKGVNKELKDIFIDWQIANLINDCSLGQYYCYKKNPGLSLLKVQPRINFLPYTGESSLSVSDKIENWSARWFKIVGGDGIFEFEFKGTPEINFVVPILLEKKLGGYALGFLDIKEGKSAKYNILGFSRDYKAFYFIPMILNDPNQKNGGFPYSWTATSKETTQNIEPNIDPNEPADSQVLLLQSKLEILQKKLIELLKAKIIELQIQLAKLSAIKNR